jgi:hypothetical protein
LRWRAFFRSFLFTTVVTAIYAFELCREVYAQSELSLTQLVVATFSVLYGMAFPFNIFSDYLSLFVIRPTLVRSGTKPVIGLALGAVSGAAIVIAGNFLRIVFFDFVYVPEITSHLTFAERVAFEAVMAFFGLLFAWPALAVFAWLPLFALGIVTARLLTPLSRIVGRTQWFLKAGKEHPLKAIGYVAAIVVFLGTVAGRAVFSA